MRPKNESIFDRILGPRRPISAPIRTRSSAPQKPPQAPWEGIRNQARNEKRALLKNQSASARKIATYSRRFARSRAALKNRTNRTPTKRYLSEAPKLKPFYDLVLKTHIETNFYRFVHQENKNPITVHRKYLRFCILFTACYSRGAPEIKTSGRPCF